jgi:hypothetical protein
MSKAHVKLEQANAYMLLLWLQVAYQWLRVWRVYEEGDVRTASKKAA